MDNTICQVVDSSGCLPREFIEQHNISEVPFYITFDEESYYRGNINSEITEFYKHMVEHPYEIPKISAPNVEDWVAVFEERYAHGDKKYIVTTSTLASSYQTAIDAKKIFEERNNDAHIEVISSNTCACGQAALEIGIAKMIDSDRDYEDIVAMAHKMVTNINTLFVVDSLKYMRYGRKIGGGALLLGKLINIKPLFEYVGDMISPIKVTRGRKNSLEAMIDAAVSRIADIKKMIIIIQDAECREDADYICNYLKEKVNYSGQIFNSNLGIMIGVHSGPGGIGIGFVEYPELLR